MPKPRLLGDSTYATINTERSDLEEEELKRARSAREYSDKWREKDPGWAKVREEDAALHKQHAKDVRAGRSRENLSMEEERAIPPSLQGRYNKGTPTERSPSEGSALATAHISRRRAKIQEEEDRMTSAAKTRTEARADKLEAKAIRASARDKALDAAYDAAIRKIR
jgi:hypothetical protein